MALGFTSFAVAQIDTLTEESSLVVAILVSVTMTTIIFVTISTIFRFKLYRSRAHFRGTDLTVAWTPLFLLDLVSLEILVGLLVWYTSH